MAHYAWLDENNVVVNVTVGVDESELIDGLDTETFYSQATGHKIKRTSYNSRIRGTYAGVGYTYNQDEDIFVAPKPYPSWIREGSFWSSPIPKPQGLYWSWDEDTLSWIEIEA
ncbi:MAG: hypothetical protein EBT43_06980 [Methylocystaceae bacterium]|nr:hypothetical protein [Methylocystaceae bacterium]